MDKTYVFSAPGRTEIGGNHTDHQRGCVLAAAVNLETLAKVTLNSSDMIRVQSEGYPAVTVNLKDLTPRDSEKNTSAALVRGIAAAFVRRGAKIQGFE
ncbi:MAG: galactokinase family protein, partial [Clostridia bacterium]|nr:galactokinase family protein [Clostridia bacterium]